MPLDQRRRIIDILSTLTSFAGNITAASPGTFATNQGTPTIFDTGGGRTAGDFVVDVAYASLATPQNAPSLNYSVYLQGAASSTFATPVVDLAIVNLGPRHRASTISDSWSMPLQPTVADASLAIVPIRVTVPFANDYAGTVYRYMRAWVRAVGTVVTGIRFKSYLSKSNFK